MHSKRYLLLSSQIERLSNLYLNFLPRTSGNYTLEELSKASAFTIFSHAEIEHYLESTAQFILMRAKRKWTQQKRASHPLLHILSIYGQGRCPEEIPSGDIWSAPIFEAIAKHESIIQSNNGIRTKHICKLLVPLGYDVRKIDTVLLNDLDTFGSMRGNEAHSTHRSNILKNFDPFVRRSKAYGILTLIGEFDQDIQAFTRRL